MALDTTTLQSAIKAAFQKAKSTPPPSDPGQADQVQEQILTQLAQDLATALHSFVVGGDVVQVVVEVKNTSNVVIGTGTQTASGRVQ